MNPKATASAAPILWSNLFLSFYFIISLDIVQSIFHHVRHSSTDFPGPFIPLDQSSQRVTIPRPKPSAHHNIFTGNGRTSCPHKQNGNPEERLLSWHLDSTWDDAGLPRPSANQNVILPAGVKVLISETVPEKLGILSVPNNSELIFGESDNDAILSLHVHGMIINGTLTAGSETCPIEKPLIITLHGSRPEGGHIHHQALEYKGLSIGGGTLDLHGKRYFPTWTRLAQTASIGDSKIVLQERVNWEAGQEIVLVTTALKDSREWHQNEVLVIESIQTPTDVGLPNNLGSVLTFTSSVQYTHYATSGYQAEVGLLSRMIKIRGASNSEPTDLPQEEESCSGRRVYGNTDEVCPNTYLTGYGGHIIIHSGGIGRVEGIELYRMGQTNFLGRYPMHFHLLGSCPTCYFKSSSVHRSFYRCISIHGTNDMLASENVAFDVIGHCMYLEDGVEENNTLSFNLAALIHWMGNQAPNGGGQAIDKIRQSDTLSLPADSTASGFYISNVHNNIIGNAASGGWAAYAFPVLHTPVGPNRNANKRPSSVTSLVIDGNTAHSTAWWWSHTGAFYFGGSLYFDDDDNNGTLVYDPGRSSRKRNPCRSDPCIEKGNCDAICPFDDWDWIRITNSKVFLTAGSGLNMWDSRIEIIGFEIYDTSLSLEGISKAMWMDDMLVVCRSGTPILLPPNARMDYLNGNGFFWYDTGQNHIMTNSEFRNCGYRSEEFDQYDSSPTRGCAEDDDSGMNIGCHRRSTVFGFLTHSDKNNPEIMQATKNITFTNCGRRFLLSDFRENSGSMLMPSTVSGRTQNWNDMDGSASGLGVPTLMGSGEADAGLWWKVDDNVVSDPQGPLEFIQTNGGPERGIGHIRVEWDDSIHDQVGGIYCGNPTSSGATCDAFGYIRHIGPKYELDNGLPVTARGDIAGLVGGFGWYLSFLQGSPIRLKMSQIEVEPTTPLMLFIPYPLGTTFVITAHAAFCSPDANYSCQEQFQSVDSVEEVRKSLGNKYHFDASTGLLAIRIIQISQTFVGDPDWILPNYTTPGRFGNKFALRRFEREGITLPVVTNPPHLEIIANCESSNGIYCSSKPQQNVGYNVCSDGYNVQTSYDRCCKSDDMLDCVFADGSNQSRPPTTATTSTPATITSTTIPTTSTTPTEPPTSSGNCCFNIFCWIQFIKLIIFLFVLINVQEWVV